MDAHALQAGFDPLELPLHRFCSWVLAWFRERLAEPDWNQFESRVYRPPAGVTPTSGPWSEAAMSAGFSQFEAQFAGKRGGD